MKTRNFKTRGWNEAYAYARANHGTMMKGGNGARGAYIRTITTGQNREPRDWHTYPYACAAIDHLAEKG
jgi:hypothetical protein